ncbi:MAG: N-acetylmuramoyl-L-alanine amidase [Bacteroidetes bacterium]|nr:N-acetylmuramoyl-L-alanine amidase [Bacteroidota bacterium]
MMLLHNLYKHKTSSRDENKLFKRGSTSQLLSFFILFLFLQNLSFAQQNIPWKSGRTTGKIPQLAYSLGNDRLGSSMMGYIDTDVLLKITDSSRNFYKVQLSSNHSAWIQKENVKLDERTNKFKNPFLVNNFIATGGQNGYDTLIFFMDEKLPYKSRMEINPARIIITLFGVESNTNFIMQHISTLKEITQIDFTQPEDDVVEIQIDLKHTQHWGYTLSYHNDTLMLLVKQAPQNTSWSNFKIGIDAGHGGSNPGSRGNNTGILEKTYTLVFARKLAQALVDSGAQVIMTRIDDASFDNTDRVLFLQQQNPDIMVSLHLNSADNRAVYGTGTFYKYLGFRNLSQFILEQVCKTTQRSEYGNVGNFNFILNVPTDFPNALVEIGFLSNKEDERKIMDANFQNQVVQGIVKGIQEFIEKEVAKEP